LKLGHKPLEWVRANISGKPPCPRYSHTMNFYEDGNFLIIHGGRNDKSDSSAALCDTFLLELRNLEWIDVKIYSYDYSQVYNRCGHGSIVFCK